MGKLGTGGRLGVDEPPASAAGLPSPLTTFVGRDEQIAEVARLLDGHRLVTLTGSGGCGKTRLALEVARRLRSTGMDEVAFVDLAPLDSPSLVGHAVAAALGVPESASLPVEEVLFRTLGQRRVLVLLDNCERVVEHCAHLVHGLLARCPSVTVLATSREPLAVAGEVTFRVPSLTLPAPGSLDPQVTLDLCESGRLFLDRARLADPGYRPDSADAAAVVSICRRLDGIPLAIELAAGRLRVLGAVPLAERLAERFELLRGGPRTAPPRQRTLEASIAWSHDLLDEPARRLFRRLAVFAGSFAADAATEVVASDDLPRSAMLGVLAELVDKSLVQVEGTSAGGRYRLLETIRQYAGQRLIEAGEEATFRTRHLDHHLALVERWEPVLEAGVDLDPTLDRIEASLDDLRAALEWSAACGQVAKGLRIAKGLRYFWVGRSRIQEGRSHLAGLLAAEGADADPHAHTAALAVAAQLCLYASDPFTQRRLASEALDAAERLCDRSLQGEALVMLGWANTFLDPPAARPLLRRAAEVLEELGYELFAEMAHGGMGAALANAGDLPGAAAEFELALSKVQNRGTWGVRFTLGTLGYVRTLQGRLDEAEAHLHEGLGAAGGYDRFHRDFVAQWLALTRTYQGAYEEAAAIHADALRRAEAAGNPSMLGSHHLALLELAVGRPEAAVELATSALGVFQLMGWRWFEAQALRILGDAAVLLGDAEAAKARWHEAMAAAEASGNPLAHTVAALGMSRAAELEGDTARARSLARAAFRAALGADYRLGAVDALEALTLLSSAETRGDDAVDAARLLAAAEGERRRIGYARFPIARPAFQRAKDEVRAALGDEFGGAWRAGLDLPLEDAAALTGRGDRRPPRPPSGWASLTPTEERVARLVGEGLTNPQIGERLFVSRRTVQSHLSHIFTKLGISTRTELAAEISRREHRAPRTD